MGRRHQKKGRRRDGSSGRITAPRHRSVWMLVRDHGDGCPICSLLDMGIRVELLDGWDDLVPPQNEDRPGASTPDPSVTRPKQPRREQ